MFAKFTCNYFSMDIPCENIDHAIMLLLEEASGDLLDPCGRHGARGHHVGDPRSTASQRLDI